MYFNGRSGRRCCHFDLGIEVGNYPVDKRKPKTISVE